MSKQLTPKQQREARALSGSELGAGPVEGVGNDFADSNTNLVRALALRNICREAAQWIRDGAPGRALELLEKALKL